MILSRTGAPFLPLNQEVRKVRLEGNLKNKKENLTNSRTDNSEIDSGVPISTMDAQGLGLVEYGQDWMGDINKNISTEQKVKNGRSRVELNGSSLEKDGEVLPCGKEGGVLTCEGSEVNPKCQPKVGRPKKGTRVPTRRSERVTKWQRDRL